MRAKLMLVACLLALASCAHVPDEEPSYECTKNDLRVAPGTGAYAGKTAILPVNPCGYDA